MNVEADKYKYQDYAKRNSLTGDRPVSMTVRRQRLYFMYVFAAIWIVILITKLFCLQITDVKKWQDWAARQHSSEIKLASERGPILDRNGTLLAVSVPSGSLYARPKEIKDKQALSKELAKLLETDSAEILKKISVDKSFVWIQRQLPRVKAEQIVNTKLEGIGFFVESRRFYPYNQGASALIGKVGVDGNGLSGVEAIFEGQLNQSQSVVTMTKDAKGNVIQDQIANEFELPKGQPVQLALDSEFQQIVDEELEVGMKNANAKAAFAVMVDSSTGEILAMSQAPAINFNQPSAAGAS